MKIIDYQVAGINHARQAAQAFEDIGAIIINITHIGDMFFIIWVKLENAEMLDKFYKEMGIGKKGRK